MSVKEHHFHATLKRVYDQVRSGDPLKGLREKAWDHFLELGLPEKNQEAFQYVSLRSLYDLPLNPPAARELKAANTPSTLVFVNGYYSPELSNLKGLPKQVVILPILEAMRSYGTFLQNRWSKLLREETDPFASLNLALHPKGVFVYIPPKCVVPTPIQCLNIVEGENIFAHARVQIFVGSKAQLKWLQTSRSSGWSNNVLDLALEEGAEFTHVGASSTDGFEAFRATLKQDSKLTSLSVMGRAHMQRQSFRLALLGENASALLQGISLLKESEQSHVHVVMEHVAPLCQSMQKFKGVLAGNSQTSFEGKILVRKDAQKTEAYQLNNNLLLGEYAIANSKPNLEIFADDVKASHGATVAQLEEEALFYLRSRGLSLEKAKALLLQGFCREILDQIPYPELRDEMVEYANNLL